MGGALRIRLVLVVGVLLAMLGPTSAAAGPFPAADLVLAPLSGGPGDVIAFSGTCGEPGWDAQVSLRGGDPYAATYAYPPSNPDGSFSGQLVIPQHFAAGDYEAQLFCSSLDIAGPDAGPVAFTVTSGPAGPLAFAFEPGAGLAGSSISATGQCPFLSADDVARVELYGPPTSIVLTPDVEVSTPTAADGTFAMTVVLPETLPVAEYRVDLVCVLGYQEVRVFADSTFTVTGPAPTTTTAPTTVPPTTVTPSVPATPTFTG